MDIEKDRGFPTTQVVTSGFAAGFIALIASLIAFTALTERTLSQSMVVGLTIAAATVMITIIAQVIIWYARSKG